MVLEIIPQGLLYCGLPCASYSWMSSSRHRRSHNNPLGDLAVPFVCYHNLIGFRVSLLLVLSIARGVHVLIEHPRASCLASVPWLQSLFRVDNYEKLCWQWTQCHFYMASFGSWSPKPSMLIGTAPYVPQVTLRAGRITKQVRKARNYQNCTGLMLQN